jgi:nucleotide-binding universal stress UspA family protein
MPPREGSTGRKILVPIIPGGEADYAPAAFNAARIARKTGGVVRLAYLAPLPPPRVDRHDRVVADTDREMERIRAGAQSYLSALARAMEGVTVETVVRFGRLSRELSTETEAFDADLVALAAPVRSRLRDRVRAWQLRRAAVGSRVALLLLPLAGDADARVAGTVPAPALR